MAVQEQRPVDGGEVEEHDQQNQQVINESKEPQHTCRMQNQGRDVIWIYLIVLKIAEVSLPKKKLKFITRVYGTYFPGECQQGSARKLRSMQPTRSNQ